MALAVEEPAGKIRELLPARHARPDGRGVPPYRFRLLPELPREWRGANVGYLRQAGMAYAETDATTTYSNSLFYLDIDWAACRIVSFVAHDSRANMLNLLRSILCIWLVRNGGLGLHASAVRNRDRLALFLGPAGRGKSTASRMVCPPWDLIADDYVGIYPCEDGHRVVTDHPAGCVANLHGEKFRCVLPLLIQKSISTHMAGLGTQEQIMGVFRSVHVLPGATGLSDMLLQNLVNLCQAWPPRRLAFSMGHKTETVRKMEECWDAL